MPRISVKNELSTVQFSSGNFLAEICLPFLKSAQNADGGWGFRTGAESRVEPTAWAILALAGLDSQAEIVSGGLRFLRSTQLPDGSWPASPGQTVGCWATSLGVLGAGERCGVAASVGGGTALDLRGLAERFDFRAANDAKDSLAREKEKLFRNKTSRCGAGDGHRTRRAGWNRLRSGFSRWSKRRRSCCRKAQASGEISRDACSTTECVLEADGIAGIRWSME